MKKLFGIIAIALLFSFAGMQNVTAAEWTITVNWTDGCNACPTIGDYEYVVCLRIRNTCTQTDVYSDCHILSSSTNPLTYVFDCDHVCTLDSEQCFLATASVVKRCVISQEEICSDSDGLACSCDEIYGGMITLYPKLE